MGKGNAAVKQWLGNPRRFADLFNGIVFQGKQVILPEDLHLATGETDILVSDKNKKAKEVQRYRDIIMRWEQGAYLVLLACENQENVHYAMPVRNMLYDSLSYVEQIRQSWKHLESSEEQKVTGAEFLSQFRKADKLVPVITLVFYYHPGAWDGSLDLHGILRWSDDEAKNKILQKYVSNYRINLVDAGNIKELENFHTDLQEIKKEEGEEQIDMCKALEDLYQDGIEQGIESGIERGAVETYQEMGVSKEEVVERIQNRFSLLTKEAEAVVEKYWKE